MIRMLLIVKKISTINCMISSLISAALLFIFTAADAASVAIIIVIIIIVTIILIIRFVLYV